MLSFSGWFQGFSFARDSRVSQVALVVKNTPADAGYVRGVGSIPGSGRSPGGEHGNPLQYSRLENPMDGGVWQVTVCRVAQSRTRLKHTLAESVGKEWGMIRKARSRCTSQRV